MEPCASSFQTGHNRVAYDKRPDRRCPVVMLSEGNEQIVFREDIQILTTGALGREHFRRFLFADFYHITRFDEQSSASMAKTGGIF